MRFFALPNLKSNETREIDPFDFKPEVPAHAKTSKSSFKAWSVDPGTDHAFVSMVEGLNGHLRVTDENPPAIIHGVIVDYDSPAGQDPIGFIRGKGGNPTFISSSYSGHLRVGWAFAEPVPVTASVAHEFINQVHKEVNAPKLFPGLDETSAKPNQYLEIGTAWRKVGPTLSVSAVQKCLFKAYNAGGYTASDIEIPLDLVGQEVERRWPGRWKGEFRLEARGPLFWVDDGIDREGCQVKPDGMLCFSDRAGKGFLSWREILGSRFVSEYETKRVGEALTGYWYDGKDFWRTDAGYGLREDKDTVTLSLRRKGFSPKAKKGAPLSEIEECLYHIQTANRVDGAAPCLFDSEVIVCLPDGRKIVNLSRVRAIQPANDSNPTLWPWTWSYLNGLLDRSALCDDGVDPYDYFWAWCSRAYTAAYQRKPLQGQALVLAGEAGRGKTLFARAIMGRLMGGWADASAFLTGQTNFNKEISEMPLWSVDDAMSSVDFKDHRRFTELLKRAVANPSVDAHAKGRDSQAVPWTGRVILSTNLDANSLAVIPNLDQSNRDKLMAFQTPIGADGKIQFPSNAEVDRILAAELPHFGKWLIDYTPNPKVLGSARFGVRSYFHPSVEAAARDNSPRQGILELLDLFAEELVAGDGKRETWEGSTSQLYAQISEVPMLRALLPGRGISGFQRDLASAEEYSRAHPDKIRQIESQTTGSGKKWTIGLRPPSCTQ